MLVIENSPFENVEMAVFISFFSFQKINTALTYCSVTKTTTKKVMMEQIKQNVPYDICGILFAI
jgi:hypothetical protein